MEKNESTMYELSRRWWNFAFEHPDTVKTVHTAIYLWNVELNNRLGWPRKFASPASQTMAACSITPKTYTKALKDLIEWGFIEVVAESRNQYTSSVISLPSAPVTNATALTTALLNQLPKQDLSTDSSNKCYGKNSLSTDHSTDLGTDLGTDHSTDFSKYPINKPQTSNHKPQTTNKGIHVQQPEQDGLSDQASLSDENSVSDTVNNGIFELENSQTRTTPLEDLTEEGKKEKSCAKKEKAGSRRKKSKDPVEEFLVKGIQERVKRKRSYTWNKDSDDRAAKRLIKLIRSSWTEKYGLAPNEEDILNSFQFMLDYMPDWYADKWDVSTLAYKYNSIMLEIESKFEKQKTNNINPANYGKQAYSSGGWQSGPKPGSSLEEIAAIISAMHN